jgi:hypothetical protein
MQILLEQFGLLREGVTGAENKETMTPRHGIG